MAVRSGFWNSVGADIRTYYNHDFSHLISLLVKDGIHQNYGDEFIIIPGTGMQVIVQTGEGWFNDTWIRNDSDLQVSIDEAPIVAGFSRIDAIAIKIDATQAVREGTIEYVAGTATAEEPSAPELVDTDEVHWHLLATVLVQTNDTEVLASRITNYIGTDTTPFISGILETISAEALLNQWQGEWEEWSLEKRVEFVTWFNDLHYILDGDVAGHLQNEIEDLYRKIGFTGTRAEVEEAIAQGRISTGMVVYITDDEGDNDITALGVSYDGTESGSSAVSVQGALDEDKAAIAQIAADLSDSVEVSYSATDTYGQMISALASIVDFSKLTHRSVLELKFSNSAHTTLQITNWNPSTPYAIFFNVDTNAGGFGITSIYVNASTPHLFGSNRSSSYESTTTQMGLTGKAIIHY